MFPQRIEMTEELRESLSEARFNVSMASAMLSYQMFRCEIYFTDSKQITTAAALVTTNKNLIMINPEFWLKELKNSKQRAFVLLHEVLHIFLDHGGRSIDGKYFHPLWNYATDFNINLTVSGLAMVDGEKKTNDRFTTYIERPSVGLYDEKYLGMSSDEIYEQLVKQFKQDRAKGGAECSGEWAEEMFGEVMDEVMVSEGDNTAQIQKNIQSAIASVDLAKTTNSVGVNELELVRMFNDMATPVVNWIDRLSHTISTAVDDISTYNRISRRSTDVCFPTFYGNHANVFFGVDSSGSMSESDYRRALGELSGILEQYDAWEVDVFTCDTAIHLIGEFSSEEGDTVIDDVYIKGGGGTEMAVMINHCNELVESGEKNYSVCIIVTDGHLMESDDVVSGVQSVFVVTENGNKNLNFVNSEVIQIQKEGLR